MKHEDRRNTRQYTQEQAGALRRKLLLLRAEQVVLITGFMALLIGALLGSSSDTGRLLGFSGGLWWAACVAVFLLLVVFNATQWRCPGCRRFLGGRNHYSQECRTCGLSLRWWPWS
jgi:hypothetical protein